MTLLYVGLMKFDKCIRLYVMNLQGEESQVYSARTYKYPKIP